MCFVGFRFLAILPLVQQKLSRIVIIEFEIFLEFSIVYVIVVYSPLTNDDGL